jgi:hypothetical protein
MNDNYNANGKKFPVDSESLALYAKIFKETQEFSKQWKQEIKEIGEKRGWFKSQYHEPMYTRSIKKEG